jgi:Cof subfamily protein (haloacid dehalogenase superfamily)
VNIPRLAAVDLDGTLLCPDGAVSVRTRDVLARARRAGCQVLFVTARHPVAVLDLARVLGLVGTAVCCVGAVLCDVPSGRISWSRALSPAVAVRIAAGISSRFPDVQLGWVHDDRVGYEKNYAGKFLAGERYHGSADQITRPVLKMFAVGPSLDDAALPVLRSLLSGAADIGHYFAGVADLVAPGVSKLATLRRYCAAHGIKPAEVVAFGDSDADIPMLRWSGHGIVMGNAEPRLHALGDEVAPGCAQDGVAQILERMIQVRQEVDR